MKENYDAKVIAYTVILDKMKMLENPHRNNKNWYIEGNSRECLKWICCGVSLDISRNGAKHEQMYLNGAFLVR